MAPPKERSRRFHRRSKQGCKACKARHVRCDERKPLCSNCLQTGRDCIYPSPSTALTSNDGLSPGGSGIGGSISERSMSTSPCRDAALNHYIGGPFDEIPPSSKDLLKHFTKFALKGQRPVLRNGDCAIIRHACEDPRYLHVAIMLSACQWGWVTGSMDCVKMSFLYHKTATYQFTRQQLEAGEGPPPMLAIAGLALAEGAVGDLEASSKHLRGIRCAAKSNRSESEGLGLPTRMLRMISNSLQNGHVGRLVNQADYQPTFMALLFSSIFDITALPPRKAPKYGWWEQNDTVAAQRWKDHTEDLHLDYEISKGFDPVHQGPSILNRDPRSSRTSFIATFLYLCAEMGHLGTEPILADWFLEQLTDDVDQHSERESLWSRALWLWCIMFGAAIAHSCEPRKPAEANLLRKWQEVYADRIRLASKRFGSVDWPEVSQGLELAGAIDAEMSRSLEELWHQAVPTSTRGETIVPVPMFE